jgi:RNA polymerase-binding transcription factor DksA
MVINFDLLHHRLEKEWESLQNRLGIAIHPGDNGQVGSYPRSVDELASDNLTSLRQMALQKQLREQMAEVEHALQKLESGTYGLCDICGQPIAPERLEALPWASLCLSCKTHQARRPESKNSGSSTGLTRMDLAENDAETDWQWWMRDMSI